jgi:uncharacterized protein DUF3987
MARNLANWVRAYMEYTRDTESPDAYHFWSAVAIIGAATKRQVHISLGHFTYYPNHYIIIVGPSGARKSAAVGIAARLAEKHGIKKFSDKITAAALIKRLSESSEKRKVEDGIEITSPLLIYSSELGVFLGPDAYATGIISDLTDLYDCNTKWEKETVGRGVETILGPYVNFLAASTPQTIKDVIPSPSIGQGFTSRIIFVWGGGRRKRVPVPPFDEGHLMLERNLLHDLKEISQLYGQFHFTPDGLEYYQTYYNSRLEPEDEYEDERLRGYSSRKDVHVLKLAMVLSLSDGDSMELNSYYIGSAVEAINYLDKGFQCVFQGVGASTTAEDSARIFRQIDMDTRKFGYATYNNIVKKNYNHLNSQQVDISLNTLLQGGSIAEEYRKNPKGQFIKCFKAIDANFLNSIMPKFPKRLNPDG